MGNEMLDTGAEGRHTPGPWSVRPRQDKYGKRCGWIDIVDAQGVPVVSVGSVEVHSDGETWTDCGVRISAADAIFIADAPETIDALRAEAERLRARLAAMELGRDMAGQRAAQVAEAYDLDMATALAVTPPYTNTACARAGEGSPVERFMALQARSDALVGEVHRAWAALSIEDRDRVRMAGRGAR